MTSKWKLTRGPQVLTAAQFFTLLSLSQTKRQAHNKPPPPLLLRSRPEAENQGSVSSSPCSPRRLGLALTGRSESIQGRKLLTARGRNPVSTGSGMPRMIWFHSIDKSMSVDNLIFLSSSHTRLSSISKLPALRLQPNAMNFSPLQNSSGHRTYKSPCYRGSTRLSLFQFSPWMRLKFHHFDRLNLRLPTQC